MKTVERNALGNSTYYFYDAVDRNNVMRDALGNPTYYFYDPAGNQCVVRDARFNSAYFGYDALNRNTALQDALGNTIYFTYDAKGNRTRITDARANSVTVGYDTLDRPSAVRDATGDATYYFYDSVGNRTKVRDAKLNTTYYFYDGLKRTTVMRNALGNSTYYFYDVTSNQTVVLNPLFHATYFGYDALNRLVRIQDQIPGTTYFEYDQVGNQTKVVDPLNHATMTRFDSVERPDAVRYADTGSAYFFYDRVSSRTHVRDPRLNTTYFGYDALRRLTQVQDALGRTAYFEYDAVSNRTKDQDAEGASASYTYDSINRRTNTVYTAAGAVVSASLRGETYFVYDQVGNPVVMGDLWGLHRMGYDNDNLLLRHRYPYAQVVYYEYDQTSQLKALVFPSTGGRQTAAYDAVDRLQRLRAATGAHTTYYEYNAASNLTRKVFPNNQKLFVTYDLAERSERWRFAKNNGQTLSYFDYTRDAKGLPTKVFREATHTVYYRYDDCDRLVAEIWSKSGTPEVYAYRYEYDLAGNRTKARMNGSDTYYFYDQANQLTVKGSTSAFASPTYYIYDRSGSLTNLVESSGATYFAYNAAGLVARIRWRDATATYFFYDGMLQRYAMVASGTLTYFLWDKDRRLLEERNAGGTVTQRNTHGTGTAPGIGTIVQSFRPLEAAALQRIYPVMDPRGSVTKWHQSDGTTVLASREYDAFGQIIPGSTTGTWPNRFGYQGQDWLEILSGDSAQRLLMSPTRLYDPADGKFLSRDPLEKNDPTSLIQTYQYVSQTPTLYVDPRGLQVFIGGVNAYDLSSRAIPLGQRADYVYDAQMGWYWNPYKAMVDRGWASLYGGGPSSGLWGAGGALLGTPSTGLGQAATGAGAVGIGGAGGSAAWVSLGGLAGLLENMCGLSYYYNIIGIGDCWCDCKGPKPTLPCSPSMNILLNQKTQATTTCTSFFCSPSSWRFTQRCKLTTVPCTRIVWWQCLWGAWVRFLSLDLSIGCANV